MLTATEIAARHGVTKQAVSRRVQRLVEQHDLKVERDNQGRIVKIDAAQYEALIGEVGDSTKSQAAPSAAPETVPAPNSLDEARRQNAWISARRNELELARIQGELVRLDRLAEAVETAGNEMATVIDRLPNAADDLSVALTRDGAVGLRKALVKLARELRRDLATVLAAVAAAAPEHDRPVEEAA